MAKSDRLEDIAPRWRDYFAANLAGPEADRVRCRVEGVLTERVDPRDPTQVDRIAEVVRDEARRCALEMTLPAALDWLRDRQDWEGEVSGSRVLHELAGIREGLAPFEPALPVPDVRVEPTAWILPAAAGAAIGALALTPLSLLLLNSREVGLFAGGVLGAAGLVGLIALLLSRPGLASGLKWAGRVGVPVALWAGVRGRPIGWLRAAGSTLGAWFLLGTVRPRAALPTRAEVLDPLDPQVRRLLIHDADLVLAWCWAHPDRLGRRDGPPGDEVPPLAGAVFRALRDVRAVVRDPASTRDDFADAAEALLQRLEDVGYRWIEVERGTPYDESMESCFRKFAMIAIGQPVEMLQPALGKDGIVVEPGMLRRVRSRGD
jgi:hypothetical protein